MSNPIQGLGQAGAEFVTKGYSGGAPNGGKAEFTETLRSAMDQIGSLQNEADDKVAQLLSGNGQDVHSAMIAVEKANLSFQMMVQVRNKIVQAYQQISAIPF